MPAFHFSPFAVPPAVAAAVVLVIAAYIVLTRFSRMSIALFSMSIAAAAWQASFALMYLAADARPAQVWARVGCACIAFIAPAMYQFATTAVRVGDHRRIVPLIGSLIAAQFAILILATDYIVHGVRRFWWGFYPTFTPAGNAVFLLFIGAFVGGALFELARAYPASVGEERARIRLFIIALAVGSLAAINALPAFGVAVYPLGWAALLGFAGIAIYNVAKHGMVAMTSPIPANEIISTMRDLLLVSDGDGRIQFVNNAASAFLGFAREDIIGHHLEDLLAPSDDTQPTLVGRWVRDREYIFRTKMGQPIELTLSHSPVTHDGVVTGAVIIGRDLRERKRYEWEARRAVTLLQSTLDSTADGILVIGQQGKLVEWNQRFAEMFGMPAEPDEQDEDHDPIRHIADQLIDPNEFRRSVEDLRAHPEAENAQVLQLTDGRRLEQYSIGRYLDHSPLRVWSFRDVTARLTAEEAVRDSEARYRALFEQNAAGVCLTTVAGRIVDCNATFAAMAGYEMEELKDRELATVLERATAVEEMRLQLEQSATVRGLEIEIKRRDGGRVSALANVSLVGRGDRALVHMTAVDISDRKRAAEQIEHQAYHDALTQLPNRRKFVEQLEMSLLNAKRKRDNVAVLFIDLDRFKTINDTLGHSVADALLVEIAVRLRSCVRQTDTVARYGGDEFTVILPDLNQPEDAAQVAEKILECVSQPVAAGGTVIEISVSIGIAVYPHDGSDLDTLLRNADDAMYRAKKAGRNGYQLSTEQMKTRASARLSMQSRLKKAMDDGELTLAYEPQVLLSSGLVAGAEALVRWNDPERGIIKASEFMPVAEETRLIVPLGEWMLFEVCRQVRRWHDDGVPSARLAVNISARQFQQRDLNRLVRHAIEEAGIDPSRVELQIRETTAMRDIEVTIEVINLLRDVGVTVALHDFGSGYSSIGSLQVLPIDAVQIDRHLIQNEAAAVGNAAIVGAVIDVARTLGMRVAADGVQTREQLEQLKQRGCHEAQGPYFGGAADAEAFAALLREGKPLPLDVTAQSALS